MKKNLKKFINLVLIFSTSFILFGCGNESIEGEWKVTKLQLDELNMDEPMSLDDTFDMFKEEYPDVSEERIDGLKRSFEELEIIFYDDGSFDFIDNLNDDTNSGTWNKIEDSDKYSIKLGGEYMEAEISGGELMWEIEGIDGIVVFEK